MAATTEVGAPPVATGGSESFNTESGPLKIGGLPAWDYDQSFNGSLREVRIYNRALSPKEIAVLHANPALATNRGLVAGYHLDEGFGEIVHDFSGHGNDGTLHGKVKWLAGMTTPITPTAVPQATRPLEVDCEKNGVFIDGTLTNGIGEYSGSATLAATDTKAGKAPAVNAETPPAPKSNVKWHTVIFLPSYNGLGEPSARRRLGIELTAAQVKKLSEISAARQRKLQELTKDRPKTTDQQELIKFLAPLQGKMKDLDKDCRKQIEAVLTSEQIQTYQQRLLEFAASRLAGSPQNPYGITIGPEQKQKFDSAQRDIAQKAGREAERLSHAALAVLSAKQLDQLRLEFEQWNLAVEDEFWSRAFETGPVKGANGAMFFPVASEAKDANLVKEQRDLRYNKPIADKLALNADQQKQFSALDAEHQKESEKLFAEVKKLSPDERKRPEIREKAAKMRKETRRRIKALLTPQQRATLEDEDFRPMAAKWLIWKIAPPEGSFTTVEIPGLLQKIALNDQQIAALRRIGADLETNDYRLDQETSRKAFEVLTPQQQDKLREVVAKQQGW
ncbi:MAG: LamG-like jellyroll fold domain-containing protein [Thermoguttaceae bacterium]